LLSAEKTPTLWRTLPAFDNLIKRLKSHQQKATTPLDAFEIIEAALSKLEDYRKEIEDVSVYVLALGKSLLLFVSSINILGIVLNPTAKRQWAKAHGQGSSMQLMRQALFEAVCSIIITL
jgi:hypothetical protein